GSAGSRELEVQRDLDLFEVEARQRAIVAILLRILKRRFDLLGEILAFEVAVPRYTRSFGRCHSHHSESFTVRQSLMRQGLCATLTRSRRTSRPRDRALASADEAT